jgi:TPR repeat protein
MNKQKSISMIAVMLSNLICTIPAFGSEPNWYARGLQAEYSGNTELAVDAYKKSAAQGLKDAKFALGRLYRDAYSNAAESFKWFLEAAQQGDIFAQYEIGLIYLNGSEAAAPDIEKAKDWLHSAAANGNHGNAAYELFRLLSTDEEASKWLQLAAKQGVIKAMQTLGEAYSKGLYGLPLDNAMSQEWLDRASLTKEQSEEKQ